MTEVRYATSGVMTSVIDASQEVHADSPAGGGAESPAIFDETGTIPGARDICDHEHTFSCNEGNGWNSGCCGKPHPRIRLDLSGQKRRQSYDRGDDLFAGFEACE